MDAVALRGAARHATSERVLQRRPRFRVRLPLLNIGVQDRQPGRKGFPRLLVASAFASMRAFASTR
jgi:hypothetical protein